MTHPICKNCKHVSDGVTYQCTRAFDAITGNYMSCYVERSDALIPGSTPRVPAAEVRCGSHGIHFEVRDGDA